MNGWIRLWIVTACLGFCITAIFVWYFKTEPEAIPHENEFIDSLREEEKKFICSGSKYINNCKDQNKIDVRMPNDFIITFVEDREESQAAAHAYWAKVEKKALRIQLDFALKGFMVWLSSTLAILIFGYGIAWIRAGFQNHKS
ncbi:hypothetical protein C8R26_11455 [Nitrosomonas oligotropha]|uniref:Transmembrane protein n=1 Tax=Nitrosomonas oligotropha TaxID=42354 RepID=A0A2T5HYU0_9PROT|nr:hypothetical protein [Nitrosomonas oligotropha]PTQ76736.1 hypothetical protein C8R26_11455 [Nitrosomonas oligotropha]